MRAARAGVEDLRPLTHLRLETPVLGRAKFSSLVHIYTKKSRVYIRTRAHAPAQVSFIDNYLSLCLLKTIYR